MIKYVLGAVGLVAAATASLPVVAPGVVWQDYAVMEADLADRVPDRPVKPSVQALALVAQEDARLFERAGPLDLRACLRAAWVDLTSGSVRQGCSTLPMTLAKSAIPAERRYGRTLSRKLLQIRLAFGLVDVEPTRVVAGVLDELPCGSSLAEGFDQCALLWFGTTRPNEAESILLATAIAAPSRVLGDAGLARRRVLLTLRRMQELGWIEPARATAIARQPLRLGMHPDLVRAHARGHDLRLVRALESAIAVLPAASEPDSLVLGAVFDANGDVRAFAGGDSSWLDRPLEAGSWTKPFCAQALLDLPGVGSHYLTAQPIPLSLPLYDRQLRSYRPGNVGSAPDRAVPMHYILRSTNTAALASMLYAHVYMPHDALHAHLGRTLRPAERRQTSTDARLSVDVVSAFAGMQLDATDLPDLPGYRDMTLSSVRTCLGTMRAHVPGLEVPTEDLAALLGVVRAPMRDFGHGLATLWLTPAGRPTELAGLMADYSDVGTLRRLVRDLDQPLVYKTASAERNAGMALVLPDEPLVLVLVVVRPSGAPVDVYGGSLAAAVPTFLDQR